MIIKRSSLRGASKITLIVFGSLFSFLVYAGFRIGTFYYGYYDLQNEMDAMIKVAGEIELYEVKRRLMEKVRENNIPITIEDFKIAKSGNVLQMEVSYSEVFYFTLFDKTYDIHTFEFHAAAETDY